MAKYRQRLMVDIASLAPDKKIDKDTHRLVSPSAQLRSFVAEMTKRIVPLGTVNGKPGVAALEARFNVLTNGLTLAGYTGWVAAKGGGEYQSGSRQQDTGGWKVVPGFVAVAYFMLKRNGNLYTEGGERVLLGIEFRRVG